MFIKNLPNEGSQIRRVPSQENNQLFIKLLRSRTSLNEHSTESCNGNEKEN